MDEVTALNPDVRSKGGIRTRCHYRSRLALLQLP